MLLHSTSVLLACGVFASTVAHSDHDGATAIVRNRRRGTAEAADRSFNAKHNQPHSLPLSFSLSLSYKILNDTTLLYGAPATATKKLGTAPSMEACATLASAANVREWTWHDSTVHGWALECVARTDGVLAPQKRSHHFSGYTQSPSPAPPPPPPPPSPSPQPPSPPHPSPPPAPPPSPPRPIPPNTKHLPVFSWETVPVFTHLAEPTPFTDDALKILAKYPLITIEKYMGPFPLAPNKGEEDNIAAVAAAVKLQNPTAKVLMYLNSAFAYPYYRLYQTAKQNGSWWVKDPDTNRSYTHNVINMNCSHPGKCPEVEVGYWQFAASGLQDAWVAACTNPAVDGCFIDGACSSPPFGAGNNVTAYEAGKVAAFNAIAAKALVVVNNKYYYNPEPPYPGVQGEFIETFSGSDPKWLTILNKSSSGHLVQAHTSNLCHNNTADGIKDLAAFLIVANEYSYFGCSSWEDQPTWVAEYDKPLGPPLGPAVYSTATGAWARSFAHGTNVSVNYHTGVSTIDWGAW